MRDYPGELPFTTSMDDTISENFDLLASRPDLLPADDVARGQEEWAALRPVLADRAAFTDALRPSVERWRTVPFAGNYS